MSDFLLTLVATYGTTIVLIATFLSCLAIPIPTSLLMLASGGFAATGDLSLVTVAGAAFGGAVAGDNSGYWIARGFGQRAHDWFHKTPKRASLMTKAKDFLDRRGSSSVFFSTWLVAPLGPWMNYTCGVTRFNWPRFALWAFVGEIFWVGIYVGLGYGFADNITAVAALLGSASGFITALVATLALGWWLMRAAKKKQANDTA
ncbi:VTT domain-containing protein [Octadecabacter sp. 1_MG-2023]|uniref:DedA family protein n=1 Tax=unclassified Octadecabacter TaxID=196158 RepID=UPI001C091D15|nr:MULTISPECIES: VTT domain-containing protein [unclassified Octadecabacter]MBU2993637.1 VTT domain-containing protein [Octadecabacter sp. B2R22]MDO6735519.1 VTT domain-containing protein [Octadecabacter sp. 1_MG-2023]